ncbi:integumentary mucin C.1-like [Teleopsis dalmanni]|uniref:integumentary mucin C.1-like n=1 Tax=Teleopsis dalmanni TaxID=139649 RepID=UPI0018CC8624|nr:integumentary mucin C.1-like [Teleopsis dalmanni]
MHFKMLLILLAFLTINNLFTNAEVLKCYYCEGDDCNDLSDNKLDSCPKTITTNPPDSTTPGNTNPTTPTQAPDDSTTPAPDSSTTPTPVSTVSTVSTTPTTIGTSSSTVSVSDSTTTTLPPVTTTTDAPTTIPTTVNLDSLQEISKNALATNILLRNYRGLSRNRRDTDTPQYACYRINVTVDGKTKDQRGCVEFTDKACDKVKTDLGATETSDCFTCQNDGCNGSTALQVSLGFILMALSLKFIY